MMKRVVMIASLTVMCMATPAFAFFMNFEEGLGNDGGLIVGIPGVTFTTYLGQTWMYSDVTTGGYNAHSVDTGLEWGTGEYNMYGYVAAWTGVVGAGGRIDFDDKNGTWFQTGVSSNGNFYLEAYDVNDNLLDSDMTGSCLRYTDGYLDMAWLTVSAPGGSTIAYVLMHDTGNFWEVDMMSGDMAGGTIVPEPGTLSLLALGVAGMVIRRFRS